MSASRALSRILDSLTPREAETIAGLLVPIVHALRAHGPRCELDRAAATGDPVHPAVREILDQ